jgi:hypothetical protein
MSHFRLLRHAAHRNVRLSNRPIGVKRFQTIHWSVSMSLAGHVLLFGIGATALPMGFEDEVERSFGRPASDERQAQARGTSFHRPVELEFPPIGYDAIDAVAIALSPA